MTRRILTTSLVLGLAFVMVGCASSKKKHMVLDDQAIVNEIKARVESPSGPPGPLSIDVDSYSGVVTLEGTVASETAKEQVVEIVRDVVKDVKDSKVQSYLTVKAE